MKQMKTNEELYHSSHPHGKKAITFKEGEFNVLSLQVDEGGCGWYRVRQMLKQFDKIDGVNTHILKHTDSEETMAVARELSSVILVRQGNSSMVQFIKAIDPGKVMVFDHDDNTFMIDPFNEHYMDYGTKDVWVGDKPVYVTGYTPGFDRFKNIWKEQEFTYLLKCADLSTAPVENLAELWAKFTGKGAVIPNGIDFSLYPTGAYSDNLKEKGEIRIGWHGGISHVTDIGTISKPLKRVLFEQKHTKFFSTGAHFRQFFKGYENRIVVNSWLPFQAHPLRLKMLDLDIGIVPLDDTKFNDYKSEVKFTELAALKIPALVIDRLPYSRVCKDGVNCLTYKTEDEFHDKLTELVGNKALRTKLAKNAYEWVREERDMVNIAKDALELYKGL